MADLITLVRTYRLTAGIADRLRLSDEIFLQLEPLLRFMIYRKVLEQDEDDVLQEIMKAVAVSLDTFKKNSHDDFMRWCRGIARHKVHDYYHSRKKTDRMEPVPPEELWGYVDESGSLSAQDKLDLETAIKIINAKKPRCYDFLWKYHIQAWDYDEIAEEKEMEYHTVVRTIERCLKLAQKLMLPLMSPRKPLS
jgi:RNA polymerase sigma factor (sigma-70 family)